MNSPGLWVRIFDLAERTAAKAPAAALRLLWNVPGFQCYRSIMEEDLDEYMCGFCPATFTTAGGATTHRIEAHPAVVSQPARPRAAVVGPVCPACMVDFRHRLRVLHHLRPRVGVDGPCRIAVLSGRFEGVHTAEAIEAADRADTLHRRLCRQRGIHVLAGPSCGGGGDGVDD